MRFAITASVCALVAASFAVAAAPSVAVPPAVDQYTEQFPDPGGGTKLEGNGSAEVPAGKSGNQDIQGPGQGSTYGDPSDDEGLAAPGDVDDRDRPSKGGARDKASDASEATASVGADKRDVRAASVAPPGNTDMEWLFPALLIVSSIAVVGVAVGRRRDRGNSAS